MERLRHHALRFTLLFSYWFYFQYFHPFSLAHKHTHTHTFSLSPLDPLIEKSVFFHFVRISFLSFLFILNSSLWAPLLKWVQFYFPAGPMSPLTFFSPVKIIWPVWCSLRSGGWRITISQNPARVRVELSTFANTTQTGGESWGNLRRRETNVVRRGKINEIFSFLSSSSAGGESGRAKGQGQEEDGKENGKEKDETKGLSVVGSAAHEERQMAKNESSKRKRETTGRVMADAEDERIIDKKHSENSNDYLITNSGSPPQVRFPWILNLEEMRRKGGGLSYSQPRQKRRTGDWSHQERKCILSLFTFSLSSMYEKRPRSVAMTILSRAEQSSSQHFLLNSIA